MKKILTLVLALLMVAVLATTVAAADDGIVIGFGEPVYNEDGTISIDIVLEKNPGFYTGVMYLDYDSELVTAWAAEVNDETKLSLTAGVGLVFSMSGNDDCKATGKLATLTLTLVENAPHGNFEISLLEGENNWGDALIDFTNANEDALDVTVKAGAFSVAHDIEHVAAVEPTCTSEGNIEYWYCKDEACGLVCTDEAMTKVSNHMSVKLPTAAHDIVAVEAVAPGCHMTGNVAHWYCKVCETVWTDEALTVISNHKSVILPELGGDVIHVEAKAPTKEAEGVQEHWYCEECEQVWADEARTQLTNHKNVIIPMLPAYEFGDVDGNGAVEVIDYMKLKRNILGTYTLTEDELTRADIDGNGAVETIDYMMLKRFHLGTWAPAVAE